MTNPLSRWVQVTEPIVYAGGDNMPGFSIETDTRGYIHQHDPDHGVYVAFPQRHVYVDSFRHLGPVSRILIEDAVQFIRAFQGQYAPKGGSAVQYDIRLGASPPDKFMTDEYDHDKVMDAFDAIAKQELLNFVGVDVDGGLLQVIPGITGWQQEGRNGGFLRINFNTTLNDFEDQLYDTNERLASYSPPLTFANDINAYNRIQKQIENIHQDILDMYYKVAYINYAVIEAVKGAESWLSSVEAYEPDLDYMRAGKE